MKLYLYALLFFSLLYSPELLGQTTNDYRATTSGEWSNASIWQRYNGSAWVGAANAPGTDASTVYIGANRAVTISSGTVTSNNIKVVGGAQLTIASSASLIVNAGSLELRRATTAEFGSLGFATVGSPGALNQRLNVNGRIMILEGASVNRGTNGTPITNLNFYNGSVYEIGTTSSAGNIPSATWDNNSTILVSGYTTNGSVPTGLDQQSIGDLEWNTPNWVAGFFDLLGVNFILNGDLRIVDTNTTIWGLSLFDTQNYTIGQDFIIGPDALVALAYLEGTTVGVSVGGNLIMNNTENIVLNGSATLNIDITGNLEFLQGTVDFTNDVFGGGGISPAGTTNIDLSGNLVVGNATLDNTSNGDVNFNFVNTSSVQQIIAQGSPSNNAGIDYTVNSNVTLEFVGEAQLTGSGSFTAQDFSTLNFQSAAVTGAADYAIQIPSANQTWEYPVSIVYNGTTRQHIEDGLPPTLAVGTLTINNPAGVELLQDVIFGVENGSDYDLILTQGNLELADQTFTLRGDILANGGAFGTTANSTLIIQGSGNIAALPVAGTNPQVGTLVVDRDGAGISIANNLTIANELTLTDGLLNVGANTLSLAGAFTATVGQLLTSANSRLVIEGSGNMDLSFASGSQLQYLGLNRAEATPGNFDFNVTLGSDILVTDTIYNLSGTISDGGNTIILANGGLYYRQNPNPLNTSIAAQITYDIIYNSSLNGVLFGTFGELNFDDTDVRNFTVQVPNGSVDFGDADFQVNGIFDIQSGEANFGNATVRIANVLNVDGDLAGLPNTFRFVDNSILSGTPGLTQFGTIIVDAGNSLDVELATLELYNNLVVNGNIQVNDGTLLLYGDDQTIELNGTGSFNNVVLRGNTIAGGVTKTVTDNFDVNGDFTLIDEAELALSTNVLTVAGDFTVVSGSILNSATSNITLDGDEAQALTSNGLEFGDLLLSGVGITTLQDSLTVAANLTLDAPLNVGSNNYSINLRGNLVNNSILSANAGTLYLTGDGQQSISGSAVSELYSLTVTNGSAATDATLTATEVRLNGILQLASGAVFDADGSGASTFRLESTSAEATALIAPLVGGAAVTGNVVVERFMDAQGASYRYIASPVIGATTDSVANDNINMSFTYVYTESEPGDLDFGWGDPYSGSMAPGIGVSSYIFRNRNQNVTFDVTGPVNQGDFTYSNITYTNTGDFTSDDYGWNLIGNPYPAPLDWNSVWNTTDGNVSNISSTAYIADNSSGSLNFTSFTAADAQVPPANGDGSMTIASGQSFWIKATAENPSLTVRETDKATQVNATFYRRGNEPDVRDAFIVALNRDKLRDEAIIALRNDAKPEFEELKDGLKRLNQYNPKKAKLFSISTQSSDGKDLVFNFVPEQKCSQQLPLSIESAEPGEYTLDFKYLNSFTSPTSVELTDKLNKQHIEITPGVEYKFNVEYDSQNASAEDSAKVVGDRFYITLNGRTPAIQAEGSKLIATRTEGPYQWYFEGTPIEGATSGSLIATRIGNYSVASLSSGCAVESFAYNNSVLGIENLAELGIKVWPNPTNGQLSYTYKPGVKSFKVTVSNLAGQILLLENISNYTGNQLTLNLEDFKAGMYIIELSDDTAAYQYRVVRK
jgi:hypothetical protein